MLCVLCPIRALNHCQQTIRRIGRIGLTAALLASANNGLADALNVVTQFGSDWVYHGNSETGGQPFAGINVDWQFSANSFAGFAAHEANVDGPRQRHRSLMAYLGTGRSIGSNGYGTLSLQHREFPGSLIEWDYTEIKLSYSYKNSFAVKLDYSPNYYEYRTQALATEFKYSSDIATSSYWYLLAGAVELQESKFPDHQYARVGAGLSLATFNMDLSYGWNSENGRQRFGQERLISPKLVFQLSYRAR